MRDITIKLFEPKLSLQQREAAIEQTSQALENRQRKEEQLQEEAGS